MDTGRADRGLIQVNLRLPAADDDRVERRRAVDRGPVSRRGRWGLVGVPLALLISAGLVYRASYAALQPAAKSGRNSWAAGVVQLDDSAGGSALFSVHGLLPGAGGQRCLAVTYTGNVPGRVH